MKIFSVLFIALGLLTAASTSVYFLQNQEKTAVLPPEFQNYWYSGKAEISGYTLEQARYKEIHKGTAALIFVTENMSSKRQVKSDNSEEKNRIPVMKLNFSRKFNTGIYPYSTMISAFTPVDYLKNPQTLKVTSTVQEWCGQIFQQLNLTGKKYKLSSFSYFENEGDENKVIESGILEDELWNRIRISPQKLPTGMQKVVPGMTASRLGHFDLEPESAFLSLKKTIFRQDSVSVYHIQYQNLTRELFIYFNPVFPYDIVGWEEMIQDLDGQKRTTKAYLNDLIMSDYWMRNSNDDRVLRQRLGFPEDSQ